MISILIAFMLTNATFTKENIMLFHTAEAVALVDDAVIVSTMALVVLLCGITLMVNNEPAVGKQLEKMLMDIYNVMDLVHKYIVIQIAMTYNNITNTIIATHQQIVELTHYIINNATIAITVQPPHFPLTKGEFVPITSQVTLLTTTIQGINFDVLLDFSSDIAQMEITANGLETIIFPLEMVWSDNIVLSYDISAADEFPEIYITWLEKVGTQTIPHYVDEIYYPIAITAQRVGLPFSYPLPYPEAEVTVFENPLTRKLEQVLNPDQPLLDLPVIDKGLDSLFEKSPSLPTTKDLEITIPLDFPIDVPTLSDFVPSDVAREYDDIIGNPPKPLPLPFPDIGWMEALLRALWELLKSILSIIKSIIATLVSLLELATWTLPPIELDLTPLRFPVADKFPFCLPFDLLKFLKMFYVAPTPPDLVIDINTKYLKVYHQIDINMLTFVIGFFRYVSSVFYGIFLMKNTRKLMKW